MTDVFLQSQRREPQFFRNRFRAFLVVKIRPLEPATVEHIFKNMPVSERGVFDSEFFFMPCHFFSDFVGFLGLGFCHLFDAPLTERDFIGDILQAVYIMVIGSEIDEICNTLSLGTAGVAQIKEGVVFFF